MSFYFNPWRRTHFPRRRRVVTAALTPLIRFGLYCGFPNVDYAFVQGDIRRLHVGDDCSTMNTIFNTVSGDIYVGQDTLFSSNCQVLTGIHRYHAGRRAGLVRDAPVQEVPSSGRDIRIGRGCFIGPGALILGGVTLGDNVIVGAGAVVTQDVPDQAFAAGVPAQVVRTHELGGPVGVSADTVSR